MSFGPKSLAGLLLAISGSFPALYFLSGLSSMAWLSVTGESATGIVTGFRDTPPAGRSRGGSTRPQVTFRDHDGREHLIEARFSLGNSKSEGSHATHELRERIPVLYPREKPEAGIMADTATIAWHILASIFSAAFILIGLWAIRSDVRQQREDGWAPRRF
jgi:hypothetical protein